MYIYIYMVFSLNIRFHTESWPEWDSSRAHDLVLTVHMVYPLLLFYIYIYIYIYTHTHIYISIIYRLIT